MNSMVSFFKAPLNQAGLVAIIGAVLGVLQGSLTWQAAVPVVAGAIIAWIIPDNSVAREDIEALVGDAIKAAGDLANKQETK
ncbi:MAG: hypothetical protein ACREFZ_00940 [Acetobacteraceae bacterium]